jgi:hypothetical protein
MGTQISMTDFVLHIDETLDASGRESLLNAVRAREGVIAVGYHNETPHLMVVVFNPKNLTSVDVLDLVKSTGVHAERTGG